MRLVLGISCLAVSFLVGACSAADPGSLVPTHGRGHQASALGDGDPGETPTQAAPPKKAAGGDAGAPTDTPSSDADGSAPPADPDHGGGTNGDGMNGDLPPLTDCDPDTLVARAPEARREILARGAAWIAEGVPYDNYAEHDGDGYREDCSGFVSMSWQLDTPGPSTAEYPPRAADVDATVLDSWDDLIPGDAVNRDHPHASGMGHIMIFAGWLGEGHDKACFFEEKGHAYGTVATSGDRQALTDDGYVPIRKSEL